MKVRLVGFRKTAVTLVFMIFRFETFLVNLHIITDLYKIPDQISS